MGKLLGILILLIVASTISYKMGRATIETKVRSQVIAEIVTAVNSGQKVSAKQGSRSWEITRPALKVITGACKDCHGK